MNSPHWWRIGVVFEKDGAPWTQTFHIRANSEQSARGLVAERVGRPHGVHICRSTEPRLKVLRAEEITVDYGPYKRSWDDPAIAHLKELL